MIDVSYSSGMPFWAIPADKLLDADDAETRAFVAEFDLISGSSVFFPEDNFGASTRADCLGKIRAAAAANPGKLLFVGNDLAFEHAVPLDELDGKREIQPLSLYTWRYVIDLGRPMPAKIREDSEFFVDGLETDPLEFTRHKLIRGIEDILIPADDPISAQLMAALVASGRYGKAALEGPFAHLGSLTSRTRYLDVTEPTLVDLLTFFDFANGSEADGPSSVNDRVSVARMLAKSRDDVEANVTLTPGTRIMWKLFGMPPSWDQVTEEAGLSTLKEQISRMSEGRLHVSSDIFFSGIVPTDDDDADEIIQTIDDAFEGIGQTTVGSTVITVYSKGSTHLMVQHPAEGMIAFFVWDTWN